MQSVAESQDPLIGQEVIGYRIVRAIGSGGMGAVYEAKHQSIGQSAAVKVLFPEFSKNEVDVRRFVAEARAASQVQHIGLVKIFNHGRLADGTAYIMMEYLAGDSLRARLASLAERGERLGLDAVLRFGRQIASALAAVHAHGIVHRDLKPANLILVPDSAAEGGERIKVVDFGIAKFDSGSATDVAQTTVGRFLGTALYASPEQCQMSGNVGTKSDVYSLGVLLYELVAGRPPFLADHAGVVIGMHLFQHPKPLWDVASATPEPLGDLIHKMLAKEPAKRPTMEEVATQLEQTKLGGLHIGWWLRRKARVLGAAATAGFMVVGGTALWLSSHRSAQRAAELLHVAPSALTEPVVSRDLASSQSALPSSKPVLAEQPPAMKPVSQPPFKNSSAALTEPREFPKVAKKQNSTVKTKPSKGSMPLELGARARAPGPTGVSNPPVAAPPIPTAPAPRPATKPPRNPDDEGFY